VTQVYTEAVKISQNPFNPHTISHFLDQKTIIQSIVCLSFPAQLQLQLNKNTKKLLQ